ncbi:MAG: lamin tail domain-containing protein [Arenimonas sp.]|nr:lamin tail domain-containing protein [Arenimonas sp.]
MRLHALIFSVVFALSAAPAAAQVVISQVYGGGGNSGAPLKSDFIELFNAGSTPVNLSGWSVQYASSTGTSWQVTALAGTVPAGGYFLVKQADGAGTQPPLPTPDATGTLSMSGTNGKVALASSATALSGACPSAVDLVGYGSANCPVSPSAPTAVLSNATAALRKGNGCTQTGNPGADFTVVAPAPRNSASAANPCSGGSTPTSPTGTAAASPALLSAGETTLLTVRVVPGTNPASTAIAVQADLTTIGGSASQALNDAGANGDLVAADGIYSVAATVALATAPGAKLLAVGITDGEARSGSASVALSVVARVGIHAIQGPGRQSPLVNADVVTEGIVTAVKTNAFFLQSAPADVDADPYTSQGILVFTGGAPPAAAAVGNRVSVAGRVVEFTSSSNPNQLSLTELTLPSVSLLSVGNPLPAPAALGSLDADPTQVDNLERFEGMRVALGTLRTTGPDEGSINEANATSTANGNFWGVLENTGRPFREPGIGALDVTPIPGGVNPPRFDTNPERIRVQSTGQVGAPVIAVDAGATVAGLRGVLDYGFGAYTLLPDPDAAAAATGGAVPRAVADARTDEVTIAGFNLLRFYDDVNDAGGDVQLTTLAFERRLAKTAKAICQFVRAPDILGVVEVENLNALTRLAAAINDRASSGCPRDTQYVARLETGNDVGNINIGFLVRSVEVRPGVPRVQIVDVTQLGKTDTDTNPNGTTSILNDRPPLVLRAVVNQADGGSFPVTVIGNHLRSLSGVNSTAPGSNGWSTDGARIRAKRASQSRFLADVVHARQVADPAERIVLLGDFNAFEYSDGYADVMGVVTGLEAPADQVLNYVDSPITTPLLNMTTTDDVDDRYSFVFEGSAQTLDHMVVNQALRTAVPGLRTEHARINADFGNDNFGDDSVLVRVSDHDPVVLFLPVAEFASADLDVQAGGIPEVTAGKPLRFTAQVQNLGPGAARDVLVRLWVDFELPAMAVMAPAGFTCAAPVVGGGQSAIDCSATSVAPGSYAFTVDAQTTAAMVGNTLTFRASVQAATDDPLSGNNLGVASTRLSAPVSDLAMEPLDVPFVLSGKDVLRYRLSNLGRDPAQDVRVIFQVSGSSTKLAPELPAGWTCGGVALIAGRYRVECTLSGDFASGRQDILALRLSAQRSDLVVVSARASTRTNDSVQRNNVDTRTYMILNRRVK